MKTSYKVNHIYEAISKEAGNIEVFIIKSVVGGNDLGGGLRTSKHITKDTVSTTPKNLLCCININVEELEMYNNIKEIGSKETNPEYFL